MATAWLLLLLCLGCLAINASHACRSAMGKPPSGPVPPRPFRKRRDEDGIVAKTTRQNAPANRRLFEAHMPTLMMKSRRDGNFTKPPAIGKSSGNESWNLIG